MYVHMSYKYTYYIVKDIIRYEIIFKMENLNLEFLKTIILYYIVLYIYI